MARDQVFGLTVSRRINVELSVFVDVLGLFLQPITWLGCTLFCLALFCCSCTLGTILPARPPGTAAATATTGTTFFPTSMQH